MGAEILAVRRDPNQDVPRGYDYGDELEFWLDLILDGLENKEMVDLVRCGCRRRCPVPPPSPRVPIWVRLKFRAEQDRVRAAG
jgi:hypothetical protein